MRADPFTGSLSFKTYISPLTSSLSLLVYEPFTTTLCFRIEIANSQKLTATSQLYNLQGKRLTRPQKGLNIVNGKMVVIK